MSKRNSTPAVRQAQALDPDARPEPERCPLCGGAHLGRCSYEDLRAALGAVNVKPTPGEDGYLRWLAGEDRMGQLAFGSGFRAIRRRGMQ